MSDIDVITETELADALQELAVRTGNGNSFFPDLARNIFEYVVAHRCEPERNGLPTSGQIRAWLRSHDWTLTGTGSAGTLWAPPNGAASIGVLHADEDATAAGRIADRIGRAADEVRQEMLA